VYISQYPFGRCMSDTNGDSLHLAQNLFAVEGTGKICYFFFVYMLVFVGGKGSFGFPYEKLRHRDDKCVPLQGLNNH
jgi:hypothetical protein